MQISQAKTLKLIESITCIMHALNDHDQKRMNTEIKKLKKASSTLPLKLKDDIQNFIVQADIQKDYDMGHGVTKKLKQLADKLVYDLKN